MKTRTVLFASIALALSIALPAAAQTSTPETQTPATPENQQPQVKPRPAQPATAVPGQSETDFTRMDLNHDGALSREELRSSGGKYTPLDANNDSRITREEWLAKKPNEPGNSMNQDFSQVDTNGDGYLSLDEIRNSGATYTNLDANGDSRISRDEWTKHERNN